MTDTPSMIITSVGEFLVHALELENESAERYWELADSMEIHNNPEVEALFRKLAQYSVQHAEEVRQRSRGVTLPQIAPWDFKWDCPASPESSPTVEGEVDYLMGTRQALDLALHNEMRGHEFYARVAGESPNPEVRRLAEEMATEESEHVAILQRWISRAQAQPDTRLEDLDPPNMPE